MCVPSLKNLLPMVQERLLDSISFVLAKTPYRTTQGVSPLTRSMPSSLMEISGPALTQLALHTLTTFDLQVHFFLCFFFFFVFFVHFFCFSVIHCACFGQYMYLFGAISQCSWFHGYANNTDKVKASSAVLLELKVICREMSLHKLYLKHILVT